MRRSFRVPLAVIAALGAGITLTEAALADTSSTESAGTTTTSASSAGSTSGSSSAAGTPSGSTSTDKPALSQAQAIAAATQVLPIPSGLGVANASLQSHWITYNQPVYNISWQGAAPTVGVHGNSFPQYYNAVVDANTGAILSYNGQSANSRWYATSTESQDAATQAAQNWMTKLTPTHAGDLSLDNGPVTQLGGSYLFDFVRKVNGIPAPFDSAQITIGPDGSLTSYQFAWHDATFPSATATVDAAAATKTYQDALGLHLAYVNQYEPGGENVVLSYSPQPESTFYTGFSDAGPWVDAGSGQAVGGDGKPLQTSSVTYAPLDSSVAPQWPTKLANPVSQSDAEALVRKALGFGSDTKLVSANAGSYSGPDGESGTMWSMTFQPSGTAQPVQVSVNADTGMIENYFAMAPSAAATSGTPITSAQAQQAAINFVKQAYPALLGSIALNPSVNVPQTDQFGQTEYNESFVLLKNGIPTSNMLVVGIDGAGQISNLSFPDTAAQLTYPAVSEAIPLAQAEQAYLTEAPLQLTYELPATQTNGPNGTQFQYGTQAELEYAPNWATNANLLDATSGQWVSADGRNAATPTDIAGHAGATEISELASIGVLPITNGQANPNATVTRAQFVSWLVQASQSYISRSSSTSQDFTDVSTSDVDYTEIHEAVEEGWLPSGGAFHPTQPITRADAANIVVRWLGWSDLANTSNLFVNPFADLTQIPTGTQGAAILVNDLGIIPAVNGEFMPNNNMTVADAAIAIVHAFRVANSVN